MKSLFCDATAALTFSKIALAGAKSCKAGDCFPLRLSSITSFTVATGNATHV
jgi:hypothetical protein